MGREQSQTFGMSLRSVIRAHEKFQDGTPLKRVVGDGYLYHRNAIFRSVRDCAVLAGVKFTVEDFCDYHVSPLFAVDKIVSKRLVPIVPNHPSLRALERLRPGQFNAMDVFPRRNFVMHESAHCIARPILKNLEFRFRGSSPVRKFVLSTFSQESFANAIEMLASHLCQTRLDSYFFSVNSYWPPDEEQSRAIRMLLRRLGKRLTFRVIFFAFLHSNFLYQSLPKGEIRVLLKKLGYEGHLSAFEERSLSKLVDRAFLMNKGFRLQTNVNYLIYNGFRSARNIFHILDFDFVDVLLADPTYLEALDVMSDVPWGRPKSKQF